MSTTRDIHRAFAFAAVAPGLVTSAALAAVAVVAGRFVPLVGAPVIALVLGAALSGTLRRPVAGSGATLAGRYGLQAAVVLFGSGLSVRAVVQTGIASLPVMLGTLGVCLLMAVLLGRLLRVDSQLRLLIGAGTGICGASAIGAVAPLIAATETQVAMAMSTIFLYNVSAVLLLPALGHLMGLSAQQFGLWAGTAVNDTSSVAAAGYAYGQAAGDYAMMVKLSRALMIIPLVLALAAVRRWRARGTTEARPDKRSVLRSVPLFLPLFLVAALAGSVGLVPARLHPLIATAATFALAVAMAGIGLGTRIERLRRLGVRPVLYGGFLSLTVGVTGLALQRLS